MCVHSTRLLQFCFWIQCGGLCMFCPCALRGLKGSMCVYVFVCVYYWQSSEFALVPLSEHDWR